MVDKAALEGLRIQRSDEKRSRVPAWAIVVPVVLALIAGAYWIFGRSSAKEVRTAPAKGIAGEARGSVLNASGYVTARRQATVSSKVTG